MAIVTQFMFDAQPLISWLEKLRTSGVSLPIHVGLAGPAKLQALIKYGLACGIGPSMKVLQRRSVDMMKLLTPYDPAEMIEALDIHQQGNPAVNVSGVHIFHLGGVEAAAAWIARSCPFEA